MRVLTGSDNLIKIKSQKRRLAILLSLGYFFSNSLAAHEAEKNFWTERKATLSRAQESNPSWDRRVLGTVSAVMSNGSTLLTEQEKMLAQLPRAEPLSLGVSPCGSSGSGLSLSVSDSSEVIRSSPFPAPFLTRISTALLPYGSIRDVHLSSKPDAPLIIHIQDAHDVEEAQKNIAAMIQALQTERGSNVVGVEGATGAFSLEPYRVYGDPEIVRSLADHFLKSGYIGGPEFAGLTAPKPPFLWGVENREAYHKNIQAFRDSIVSEPLVKKFLADATIHVDHLKQKIYSPGLMEFDRHFHAYQNRGEGLGSYVTFLTSSIGRDFSRFPNLQLLRDALRREERIDFSRVERERANLLETLAQNLPESELNRLVQQSLDYRLGRSSCACFYRSLKALCRSRRISLDPFCHFNDYVDYILTSNKIDRQKLLFELSDVEKTVQNALAVTPPQKELVGLDRRLLLLDKLTSHAMTPEDFAIFLSDERGVADISQDLNRMAVEHSLPVINPLVPERIEPFRRFCDEALRRNKFLVDNLLGKVRQEKVPVAVLVTGGFHTDGLTQLLRQKNVSYLVVTPRISSVPKENHYLDVFAGNPLPLEKLFSGEAIFLASERLLVEDVGQIKFTHSRLDVFESLYPIYGDALTRAVHGGTLAPLDRPNRVLGIGRDVTLRIERDLDRKGYSSVFRYTIERNGQPPVRCHLAILKNEILGNVRPLLGKEGITLEKSEFSVGRDTFVLVLFKSPSLSDAVDRRSRQLLKWMRSVKDQGAHFRRGASRLSALHAGRVVDLVRLLMERTYRMPMPFEDAFDRLIAELRSRPEHRQNSARDWTRLSDVLAHLARRTADNGVVELGETFSGVLTDLISGYLTTFLMPHRFVGERAEGTYSVDLIRLRNEFRRLLASPFFAGLGIDPEVEIRVFQGNEVIQGQDRILMAPFIVREGKAHFFIHQRLMDSLPSDEDERGRRLASIAQRELLFQQRMQEGFSFDAAHERVRATSSEQEALFQWAQGVFSHEFTSEGPTEFERKMVRPLSQEGMAVEELGFRLQLFGRVKLTVSTDAHWPRDRMEIKTEGGYPAEITISRRFSTESLMDLFVNLYRSNPEMFGPMGRKLVLALRGWREILQRLQLPPEAPPEVVRERLKLVAYLSKIEATAREKMGIEREEAAWHPPERKTAFVKKQFALLCEPAHQKYRSSRMYRLEIFLARGLAEEVTETLDSTLLEGLFARFLKMAARWRDPFLEEAGRPLDGEGGDFDWVSSAHAVFQRRMSAAGSDLDLVRDVHLTAARDIGEAIRTHFPTYESGHFALSDIVGSDKSNCVGYATMFFLLARAVGLDARYTSVVKADFGIHDIGHVANTLFLPAGEMVVVDVTWGNYRSDPLPKYAVSEIQRNDHFHRFLLDEHLSRHAVIDMYDNGNEGIRDSYLSWSSSIDDYLANEDLKLHLLRRRLRINPLDEFALRSLGFYYSNGMDYGGAMDPTRAYDYLKRAVQSHLRPGSLKRLKKVSVALGREPEFKAVCLSLLDTVLHVGDYIAISRALEENNGGENMLPVAAEVLESGLAKYSENPFLMFELAKTLKEISRELESGQRQVMANRAMDLLEAALRRRPDKEFFEFYQSEALDRSELIPRFQGFCHQMIQEKPDLALPVLALMENEMRKDGGTKAGYDEAVRLGKQYVERRSDNVNRALVLEALRKLYRNYFDHSEIPSTAHGLGVPYSGSRSSEIVYTDHSEEFLEYLMRLSEMVPDSFATKEFIGLQLLNMRRYEEAKPYLMQVIDQYPDHMEPQRLLMVCDVETKNWPRVLSLAEGVLRIKRNNKSALFAKGEALRNLKRWGEAEKYYQRLLLLFPNDENIISPGLLECRWELGKKDDPFSVDVVLDELVDRSPGLSDLKDRLRRSLVAFGIWNMGEGLRQEIQDPAQASAVMEILKDRPIRHRWALIQPPGNGSISRDMAQIFQDETPPFLTNDMTLKRDVLVDIHMGDLAQASRIYSDEDLVNAEHFGGRGGVDYFHLRMTDGTFRLVVTGVYGGDPMVHVGLLLSHAGVRSVQVYNHHVDQFGVLDRAVKSELSQEALVAGRESARVQTIFPDDPKTPLLPPPWSVASVSSRHVVVVGGIVGSLSAVLHAVSANRFHGRFFLGKALWVNEEARSRYSLRRGDIVIPTSVESEWGGYSSVHSMSSIYLTQYFRQHKINYRMIDLTQESAPPPSPRESEDQITVVLTRHAMRGSPLAATKGKWALWMKNNVHSVDNEMVRLIRADHFGGGWDIFGQISEGDGAEDERDPWFQKNSELLVQAIQETIVDRQSVRPLPSALHAGSLAEQVLLLARRGLRLGLLEEVFRRMGDMGEREKSLIRLLAREGSAILLAEVQRLPFLAMLKGAFLAAGVLEEKEIVGERESILQDISRRFNRHGMPGVQVRVHQGSDLVDGPDRFLLAPLYSDDNGQWVFSLSEHLLDSLMGLEEKKREDYWDLLVRREVELQRILKTHHRYEIAHREVLALPRQQEFFDWVQNTVVVDILERRLPGAVQVRRRESLTEVVGKLAPPIGPIVIEVRPVRINMNQAPQALADLLAHDSRSGAVVGEEDASLFSGISHWEPSDFMDVAQKMRDRHTYPAEVLARSISGRANRLARAGLTYDERQNGMAELFVLSAMIRFLEGEQTFLLKWGRLFTHVLQAPLLFDPSLVGRTNDEGVVGLNQWIQKYHDRFLREAFKVTEDLSDIRARVRNRENFAMDLEMGDPKTQRELKVLGQVLRSTRGDDPMGQRIALVVADRSVSRADTLGILEAAGISLSHEPRLNLLLASEGKGDWLVDGRIVDTGVSRFLGGRLDVIYAIDKDIWSLTGIARLIFVLSGGKVYDAAIEVGSEIQERALTLIQS